MNTEILGVALQILLLIVISYPLGKHIAKVYKEGNDCMRFMAPIERFIYKLAAVSYTHLTLPTKAVECRSRWSPYH